LTSNWSYSSRGGGHWRFNTFEYAWGYARPRVSPSGGSAWMVGTPWTGYGSGGMACRAVPHLTGWSAVGRLGTFALTTGQSLVTVLVRSPTQSTVVGTDTRLRSDAGEVWEPSSRPPEPLVGSGLVAAFVPEASRPRRWRGWAVDRGGPVHPRLEPVWSAKPPDLATVRQGSHSRTRPPSSGIRRPRPRCTSRAEWRELPYPPHLATRR